MAYTSHGHHIPGTTLGAPPPKVARCGGPRLCPQCKSAVREFTEVKDMIKSAKPTVPMDIPDDFTAKAKCTLINYIDSHYSQDFEKPVFEVYVVWFVKVLQHWKALVATDRLDGKYYEITYNGDRREAYLDEYQKVQHVVIPD